MKIRPYFAFWKWDTLRLWSISVERDAIGKWLNINLWCLHLRLGYKRGY